MTSQDRPEKKPKLWPLAAIVMLVLGLSLLAQTWQERGQARALQAAAGPGDILMLSSDTCIFCRRAREWLDAHQVAYRECSIERDAACLAMYRQYGAQGTPTFVVRDRRVLGWDRAALLAALDAPR